MVNKKYDETPITDNWVSTDFNRRDIQSFLFHGISRILIFFQSSRLR